MSRESPADWNDLSRLWQAEGAAVSPGEIEGYMRRERAMTRLLAALELAGLGLGLAVGAWLAMASHFAWVGGMLMVECVVMAWVAWRRREPEIAGSDDLMTSLQASIAREDWTAATLRFGRALSFMVLFAVLLAASQMLRTFRTTGAAPLWALLACGLWVCGVLAWNLVLVRRSQRRQERLEGFASRLRG